MKKLYIFDADGTLCERSSGQLLPNTLETINSLSGDAIIAIATNQGGPACHDAGWDFSNNFPSLEKVEAQYKSIQETIGADALYMSLLYITKSGQRLLPNGISEDEQRARLSWRKPNGGMITQAMYDFKVSHRDTVLIGDSDDDDNAARDSGVQFIHADEFFGRE